MDAVCSQQKACHRHIPQEKGELLHQFESSSGCNNNGRRGWSTIARPQSRKQGPPASTNKKVDLQRPRDQNPRDPLFGLVRSEITRNFEFSNYLTHAANTDWPAHHSRVETAGPGPKTGIRPFPSALRRPNKSLATLHPSHPHGSQDSDRCCTLSSLLWSLAKCGSAT